MQKFWLNLNSHVVRSRYLRCHLAALLTAINLTSASAQKYSSLSEFECNYIRWYESAHEDHDFPDLVGHMGHTAELCETGTNCEIVLTRRTKPFFLTLDKRTLSDTVPAGLGVLVAENLAFTSEYLRIFAGVEFGVKSSVARTEGQMHLIFVKPNTPSSK